ncbi:MAG: NlpC/P60 family protein [Micromonosporaceae bacterium]
MVLEPGRPAVVAVGVATLWRGPDAPRPVDHPALAAPPDTAAWVRGMSHDERIHDGVLTQLLLGERVLVEQVRDGWVRAVALDQPAGRLDPRGYPGWLPASHLAPEPHADSTGLTWVVDAAGTALRDAPDGAVTVPQVVAGTRLVAAEAAQDGWLPVRVPGRRDPAWAPAGDLTPTPQGPADAGQVLAFARRLLGIAYVWGGMTPYGIDCSGLVHLAWRRHGVVLPRDADDQARAVEPVPLGEERPGDLYFFARPGRPVHHIGFVASAPVGTGEGERQMVHACYTQRRVVAEPVTGDRHATLVAAGRVRLPAP